MLYAIFSTVGSAISHVNTGPLGTSLIVLSAPGHFFVTTLKIFMSEQNRGPYAVCAFIVISQTRPH